MVVLGYFTKWIEAEPLAKITARQVQDFVWKDIVCQFGIPHTIIIENRRQFTNRKLAKFYEGLNILHKPSFVKHAHTNDQVESANRVIFKEKVGNNKGKVDIRTLRGPLG